MKLVEMERIFICFLVVLMTLTIFTFALAQFDVKPYTGKPNPGLKEKIHKGKIGSLFEVIEMKDGFYEQWATSTLKPEGRPPKVKPFEEDEGESLFAHCEWSCQYCAYSAMDKDSKTAWAEGVPGDGIGEIVIVLVDTRKPVKIWAGFGKSKDIFKKNNRPKKICVYVLQGRWDYNGCTERGNMYTDIHVVAKHTITLKSLNGYQPLRLPKHTIRNKKVTTFVAVEILSIYPGTKYRDTCISEIRN